MSTSNVWPISIQAIELSAIFWSTFLSILDFKFVNFMTRIHMENGKIFVCKKGHLTPQKYIFPVKKDTIICSETWEILKLQNELKSILGALNTSYENFKFSKICRFKASCLWGKWPIKLSRLKRLTAPSDRKHSPPRTLTFPFWV